MKKKLLTLRDYRELMTAARAYRKFKKNYVADLIERVTDYATKNNHNANPRRYSDSSGVDIQEEPGEKAIGGSA